MASNQNPLAAAAVDHQSGSLQRAHDGVPMCKSGSRPLLPLMARRCGAQIRSVTERFVSTDSGRGSGRRRSTPAQIDQSPTLGRSCPSRCAACPPDWELWRASGRRMAQADPFQQKIKRGKAGTGTGAGERLGKRRAIILFFWLAALVLPRGASDFHGSIDRIGRGGGRTRRAHGRALRVASDLDGTRERGPFTPPPPHTKGSFRYA